ncbi:lipopolysaccharide biosynthesis protein [Algicola sagamiensis]|uniref:lipopolysaccharide biosynthesis protein n=1 Tax=Algicola sagamiensis TaxID=163869 RepID=UPI00035CF35D|nr:oligosaccharide flippase family protein [Algicola sagamiensis]
MPKLLQSISVYALANIIGQLFSFALVAVYTSVLTPREFGLLSTIEVAIFLCNSFVLLALDRAAQRYYYDEDEQYPKRVINTVFWLVFGWTLCLMSVMIILDAWLGLSELWLSQANILGWIIWIAFGFAMNSLTLVYCQIHQKPHVYLRFILCKVIALGVLTWWFIYEQDQGVQGYLHAQAVTFAVLACIAMPILKVRFTGLLSFSSIRPLFAFSLPFVPTLISSWLMGMANRLVLEQEATLEAVAIFSLAYKISSVYFLATSAVALAFTPTVYETLKEHKTLTADVYALLSKLHMALVLFAVLICLFAQPMLSWFFQAEYQPSFALIGPLLLVHYLSAYMGLTSNLTLSFFKRNVHQMCFFIVCSVLCVGLNLWLIPHYASYGAVLASIVSMVFLTLIHWTATRRLKLPDMVIRQAMIGAGILLGCCIVNAQFIYESFELNAIQALLMKFILISIIVGAAIIHLKGGQRV